MKEYAIYCGLGGGFGGARFSHIQQFKSYEEALEYAWELACEEYEGMAGLHGLKDIDEIMHEEDIDDYDEAYEIFCDERESWVDYYVVEVEEGQTEEDFC
jgi:hypothetical protein